MNPQLTSCLLQNFLSVTCPCRYFNQSHIYQTMTDHLLCAGHEVLVGKICRKCPRLSKTGKCQGELIQTDSNWFKNNTKAMSTSYDSGEDILGGLEDIFFHFAQCLSLDSWRKKVARKSCDHSLDPGHGRGPLAASFPRRICCKSDEQETLIFSSHLQLCTWALEVMIPLWELQPSILLPPHPPQHHFKA